MKAWGFAIGPHTVARGTCPPVYAGLFKSSRTRRVIPSLRAMARDSRRTRRRTASTGLSARPKFSLRISLPASITAARGSAMGALKFSHGLARLEYQAARRQARSPDAARSGASISGVIGSFPVGRSNPSKRQHSGNITPGARNLASPWRQWVPGPVSEWLAIRAECREDRCRLVYRRFVWILLLEQCLDCCAPSRVGEMVERADTADCGVEDDKSNFHDSRTVGPGSPPKSSASLLTQGWRITLGTSPDLSNAARHC